jgi:uncharacterized LabA/DUF88 family protein
VRTYIYIDGFNFYYGAVKDTPHKWLDFKTLFIRLLPSDYQIDKIKYFTAIVEPSPSDPQKAMRQQIFIRALKEYIPEFGVYKGKFLSQSAWLPLERSEGEQLRVRRNFLYACVIRTEEKGSDVNLAVHMVNDASKNLYDCAVVVSNDSDLAEALRIVRYEWKKHVVLLTPPRYRDSRSKQIKAAANFCRTIKHDEIAASQLPDLIPGSNIHKPAKWKVQP